MGFSRQECWGGLPFPSPGDLPDPGIEPGSPALQADALPSKPKMPNYFVNKGPSSQGYGFSSAHVWMWTSLVTQTVKRLSTMRETQVRSQVSREDPLEKEMAIHSSTIAWKIPWTEDPGRLQSIESQRI